MRKIQQIAAFLAQIEGKDPQVSLYDGVGIAGDEVVWVGVVGGRSEVE